MNISLLSLVALLTVLLSSCVVDPDPGTPPSSGDDHLYYTLFAPDGWHIWSIAPDGSASREVLRNVRMFCSPRAGKIAYYRAVPKKIMVAVANLDGSSESIIDTQSARVEPIVLSPDGTTLAYFVQDTVTGSGIRHLWIADIATRNRRHLTILYQWKQHQYQQITFSPDSRRIAVNAGPNIHIIHVHDLSQRTLRVAEVEEDTVTWVEWAPSGERIAYEMHRLSNVTGKIRLFVINSDGSGKLTLLDSSMAVGECTWSPKGDELAVGRIMQNHGAPVWSTLFQLWTIKSDGSGGRMLVADSITLHPPQWSSDGDRIAFENVIGMTQDSNTVGTAIFDLRTSTVRLVAPNARHPRWGRSR